MAAASRNAAILGSLPSLSISLLRTIRSKDFFKCVSQYSKVTLSRRCSLQPKRNSLCLTTLLKLESEQNAPMAAAYWHKCYRVLLFLCANAPSQSRSPHVMGAVRSVQTPHYQAFVIHSSVAIVTRLEGCARARVVYIRRTCSRDS
jgi:hypothetical protein